MATASPQTQLNSYVTDDEVIPVLPCGVLGETLDFYRALGLR